MPVVYEEPQKEYDPHGRDSDEYTITHPAYAQITASNVTGGVFLYGSDFQHNDYVCITIMRSRLNRHLSTDWSHTREELIEIAMSPAQWATFVSSMNRGSGVQCTLRRYNGKTVPQIPRPEMKDKVFRLEAEQSGREAIKRIETLTEEIQNSKLSAKQKEAWINDLHFIRDRTRSNLTFVLQRFGEHMEETVQKARTEIAAYTHNMLVRTGIAKLIGNDKAKKILGYRDEDDEQ
jgi:hypothetical protein